MITAEIEGEHEGLLSECTHTLSNRCYAKAGDSGFVFLWHGATHPKDFKRLRPIFTGTYWENDCLTWHPWFIRLRLKAYEVEAWDGSILTENSVFSVVSFSHEAAAIKALEMGFHRVRSVTGPFR